MKEIAELSASWPTLNGGLHYQWLVDYPAYSAYGTYELSNEEWENRDLIQNFKGNSELTTEIDHQQALKRAIQLASKFVTDNFGDQSCQLTLLCVPAAHQRDSKRRFEQFSQAVCDATGMHNAFPTISYTSTTDEDGDIVETFYLDNESLKGKNILIFDDIIASGGSVARFAERLQSIPCQVVGAFALGKKISDGYDK